MNSVFLKAEEILRTRYIHREREIRGLVLAVLSNENVLIIGPPGTAKSAIVEDFACLFDATYFSHLLTKFSVPEELFGPVSYSSLKKDIFRHVPDGMLQEAQIAFIDEIFKANSGVLNSMLNVMNERVYKDAGKVVKLPLRTMIAASNELMESEALNAMFDRFLVRFHVDYLDPHGKIQLIKSRKVPLAPLTSIATVKDIEVAQAAIAQIGMPDDVIEKYMQITTFLRVNNRIETSDRRDVKIWNVLKAHAWLEGGTEVTVDDFDILPDLLWRVPDERTEILKAVIKIAAPTRAKVNGLVDDATELARMVHNIDSDKNKSDGDKLKELTGVHKQIKQIKTEVDGIFQLNQKPFVADAKKRTDDALRNVGLTMQRMMGVIS